MWAVILAVASEGRLRLRAKREDRTLPAASWPRTRQKTRDMERDTVSWARVWAPIEPVAPVRSCGSGRTVLASGTRSRLGGRK